jgi:hypothetical protein
VEFFGNNKSMKMYIKIKVIKSSLLKIIIKKKISNYCYFFFLISFIICTYEMKIWYVLYLFQYNSILSRRFIFSIRINVVSNIISVLSCFQSIYTKFELYKIIRLRSKFLKLPSSYYHSLEHK